ncbi:MAG TPA: cytochrome P460 family protein [Steroidobacteraceae bacterium]|nr:cytochrome P460 family protein [Steroidobacteraceae bacterium]
MKNISGNVPKVLAAVALLSAAPAMADPAIAGPQFNERGELARPEDYRSWVFLNSALGLTYGPNRPPAGAPQVFTSVFVNPKAYAEFQKSGQWPDGTIFALEVRPGIAPVSALEGAITQGPRRALEAAVRDSSRYPDGGWSYFSFDGPPDNRAALRSTAAPLPRTASCYACHQKHGAVQWTFTQFYADAFERAQQLGTVRKDYDPARRIEDAGH